MSNGNSVLALAVGAGAGLGLWYLLDRDDKKDAAKKDAPPTSATAAPTSSPGTSAAPTPCPLRLDAAGLTAEGVPLTVSGAVARCQAAGRALLTIAGTAPGTVYADLVAALGAAGITIQEHRNARSRSRSRRQDGGALATLRTLAARVRASTSTRQGSGRKDAAAKLARFVARHSGAEVNDDAVIDFENNVVVNGTPDEMRKVAAWVERLARDSGRPLSATVETFDDPDDDDWAVCRIRGLGIESL